MITAKNTQAHERRTVSALRHLLVRRAAAAMLGAATVAVLAAPLPAWSAHALRGGESEQFLLAPGVAWTNSPASAAEPLPDDQPGARGSSVPGADSAEAQVLLLVGILSLLSGATLIVIVRRHPSD